MHYTGMLAMQSVAVQLYDPLLVVVSVVVASLASLGALLLAFACAAGPASGPSGCACWAVWSWVSPSSPCTSTGMAALTLAPCPSVSNRRPGGSQSAPGTGMASPSRHPVHHHGRPARRLGRRNASHAQRLRLERVSTTLDQITLHDPLTHLLNGGSFIQTVDRATARRAPVSSSPC